MLSTLLKKDSGEIFIKGMPVGSQHASIRRILGVVPQEIALYEDLTAIDNLRFFGSMYGVKGSLLEQRIRQLLDEFGLADRASHKITGFSGGMKRRINIAAALVHEPEVLFMDEPTVGIDPQSRNNIYDAISAMREKGITILYTTHYMEEAERFSDRIGIIDQGHLIAEGTLQELRLKTEAQESLEIEFTHAVDQALTLFDFNGEIEVTGKGNQLRFRSKNIAKELPRIIARSNEVGLELRHVDVNRNDLESIFLSLTGKTLRD